MTSYKMQVDYQKIIKKRIDDTEHQNCCHIHPYKQDQRTGQHGCHAAGHISDPCGGLEPLAQHPVSKNGKQPGQQRIDANQRLTLNQLKQQDVQIESERSLPNSF